jgi:hypothetical protein
MSFLLSLTLATAFQLPDFEMPVTPTEFIGRVEDYVKAEIITFVGGAAAIAVLKSLMFPNR